MGKRPMCLICLLLILILFLLDLAGFSRVRGNPVPDKVKARIDEQKEVLISGEITGHITNSNFQTIYLENTILIFNSQYSKIQKNIQQTIQQNRKNTAAIGGVKADIKGRESIVDGSRIFLKGILTEMQEATNPGGFDEREYYACKHIYYKLEDAKIVAESREASIWKRNLQKIRDRMKEIIQNCSEKEAPYFEAILLGQREDLEAETKLKYQQAGILHILTISGLHIGMIGNALSELLEKCGLGILPGGFFSFGIILFYGLLTGSGAATLRAVIMFVMRIGAKLLGKSFDMQTAIASSAVLLLLDCPALLFNSSFWFSFSTILGITVTAPIVQEVMGYKNKQINSLLFSICLQITMLPALLFFQGEISVIGIALNFFLLPTVMVVLASGMAMLCLGMFSIKLGSMCAWPGRFLLRIYEAVSDFALRFPYASWIAGRPSKIQLFLYVFLWSVALYISRWFWKQQRRKAAFSLQAKNKEKGKKAVFRYGFVLFVFLSIWLLVYRKNDQLFLTCLDVGQGDCVVIQTSDGKRYVSDCGSSNVSHVGKNVLIPYLKQKGISHLDGIFLSHGDEDHISGILELLEMKEKNLTTIQVECLWIPKYSREDEGMKEVIEKAENNGILIQELSEQDHMKMGDVEFCVFSPNKDTQIREKNEGSLVYELKYRNFRALFTGDIGIETEQILAEKLEKVDFLKVAHHGSAYSTGKIFLEQIKPQISVISCSKKNRYGHPSLETVQRLKEVESEIFYSMKDGAVTISTDGRTISVETYVK